MNKLDMAHDYLKVLLTQNTRRTVGEAVETAYALADAMQAEADKRLKTDVGNTDASEWQPDWSQAPDWANWWAIDKDLVSFWHEDKPKFDEIEFYQCGMFCDAPRFNYQGNWQDSLRKRP